MRHLFAFLAMAGVALSSPAFAQDDAPAAPAAPAEEAATPEEAAEGSEEADAPKAPEADAAEAEAPEAEAPEADAPEAEAPKAPEADADEADADEADADEAGTAAPKADEDAVESSEDAEVPKVPETDAEAVQTVQSLVEAIQAGQWPLAVGLLLTLLVYGVNRFALKDKVGEKVIPWVAGGVGLAGATGVGLVSGEPIVEAVVAGVIAAVMAVGGWEALLKHLTAPKVPSTVEPPTS